MATNTKLSHAAAAACIGDGANAGLLPLLAAGTLKIYSGSQPADPDTAITDQVLLATYTFPSPAASENDGVLTLLTVAAATITTGGTAAWFRIATSGGAALWDGSIGTSAADLILNTVTLLLGGSCSALTGDTLTIPAH